MYVISNLAHFHVCIQEDVIRIIKAARDGDEEILNQTFDAKKYDVNDIHDLAVSKLLLMSTYLFIVFH